MNNNFDTDDLDLSPASPTLVDKVDHRRRALFGNAGTMLAASAGLYALLSSREASASCPPDCPPAADPATGWYILKDFGVAGDGTTDDTVQFQYAIDYCSSEEVQRPLFVPPGVYKITSPLVIPPHTMLIGSNPGLAFGCRIQPFDCPAFIIGGATSSFHISIENLMISPVATPSASAPDFIISMDNSYSVVMRNIYIFGAQSTLGTAAVKLLGNGSGGYGKSNNIIWDNLIVRNDAGQPNAAAVLAGSGCGTHHFIAPNLENYRYLFDWRGGKIDLVTPYFERAGTYGVNCNPDPSDTDIYLNTYGGMISASESGIALAIRSTARNVNSFSTQWSNGHPTSSNFSIYVYGVPSRPAVLHGTEPILSGAGFVSGGGSDWQRGISFPDYALRGSASWSVTLPGAGGAMQATTQITVPGVQLNAHRARARLSVDQQGLQLSAYVSAANTVTVIAVNNSGNPISVSGTVYVDCEWI